MGYLTLQSVDGGQITYEVDQDVIDYIKEQGAEA